MKQRWYSPGLAAVLALAACGGEEPANGNSAPPQTPSPFAALVLSASPAGAITVQAARAAGPTDAAVVTGRVASIVSGFAVFTLVDLALPYCGEGNAEDDCKTPWDYCCESAETRTANTVLVEARGADGEPLAAPTLPELRLLDRVSVTGRITEDEHGNPVLLATGWYREERPQLPDGLRWPGSK